MAKKWLSPPPKKCDICETELTERFVDGATVDGPWGFLCEECHDSHGIGLGLGKGQLYEFDGKDWLLKAGGAVMLRVK